MNDESREPAFPIQTESSDKMNVPNYGLTKREYFAAMAMQGILASGKTNIDFSGKVAIQSIHFADELLKQLSQ